MKSGKRALLVLVVCPPCLKALQLLTCRTRKTKLSALRSFVRASAFRGGREKDRTGKQECEFIL